MKSLFGPCTIVHNSIDMGSSSGGGSLEIITTTQVIETLDGPICDPVAKYGTGKLNMFIPISGTIATNIEVADFASLVLTGEDFVITMPSAKLLWPTGISFGTNVLNPFVLGFFFKPSGGVLIKFT